MIQTNKDRAKRAQMALLAHQIDDCHGDKKQARVEIKADPAAILAYLLADIRHLCDQKGLDYAKADRRGYEEYLQDKADERYRNVRKARGGGR